MIEVCIGPGGKRNLRLYRAKFSDVERNSVLKACITLGVPNKAVKQLKTHIISSLFCLSQPIFLYCIIFSPPSAPYSICAVALLYCIICGCFYTVFFCTDCYLFHLSFSFCCLNVGFRRCRCSQWDWLENWRCFHSLPNQTIAGIRWEMIVFFVIVISDSIYPSSLLYVISLPSLPLFLPISISLPSLPFLLHLLLMLSFFIVVTCSCIEIRASSKRLCQKC